MTKTFNIALITTKASQAICDIINAEGDAKDTFTIFNHHCNFYLYTLGFVNNALATKNFSNANSSVNSVARNDSFDEVGYLHQLLLTLELLEEQLDCGLSLDFICISIGGTSIPSCFLSNAIRLRLLRLQDKLRARSSLRNYAKVIWGMGHTNVQLTQQISKFLGSAGIATETTPSNVRVNLLDTITKYLTATKQLPSKKIFAINPLVATFNIDGIYRLLQNNPDKRISLEVALGITATYVKKSWLLSASTLFQDSGFQTYWIFGLGLNAQVSLQPALDLPKTIEQVTNNKYFAITPRDLRINHTSDNKSRKANLNAFFASGLNGTTNSINIRIYDHKNELTLLLLVYLLTLQRE